MPERVGPSCDSPLLNCSSVQLLTIATLGAILAGIATAAEAAAFGALGAILLVIAYGRFTLRGLINACYSTLATTSMVLFLAVASNVFGAVFAWLGTASWMTKTLLASPLPPWGTMTMLLTLIFLLGWPFEWPAIVLIFLPLLAPVAKGLGYDMVWFGCIVAVVLQTAFLSPRGHVRLLSQAGGQGMELEADLPRYGRFHDPSVHLRSARAHFPGHCHVVPKLVAGSTAGGKRCPC
jgi:hypothetical protein